MENTNELEITYKKLHNNREELCSVAYNIIENVNQLYDNRIYPKSADTIEKNLQEAIKGLIEIEDGLEELIKEFNVFAPPFIIHQDISQLICNTFFQFCKDNSLHYRILNAPVKVVLDDSGKYYEPDIIIIFDNEKIKADGCYGAPDIIFEIVSRSTKRYDCEEKRNIYLKSGVKEYFIVDPIKKNISICCNEKETIEKKFSEDFKIENIPGLTINIHDLLLSYLY